MTSSRNAITAVLMRGEQWLFANPRKVLAGILLFTLGFALCLPNLRIYTDFNDLLPQKHPYVQTYHRITENFGGANQIVMVVAVEQGTVLDNEALALIDQATQGVDSVTAVNHNLVSSLTHRTVRKVVLMPDGNVTSELYFDPKHPQRSEDELAQLRKDVAGDPKVYGLLVSTDLKAALIRAQLNEGHIDYARVFGDLAAVRDAIARPGVEVYLTGQPVLTGYVYTYLGQILTIMAWTLALITLLLIGYFRRFYGVFLPLLGIALSSIWGLGFMALCGFNLEPLSMPIPFLIAARATSHGVQLVARYYEELAVTHNGQRAARNALDALFRPGSLAIVVDAVGIGLMVLGTAPFNYKLGMSAGFWALSVIFTVHFMVPLALTVLPQPRNSENKNEGVRHALARFMAATGGRKRGPLVILGGGAVLMAASVFLAVQVPIGDSEPGSPLLKREHPYNQDTVAINGLFPGADEFHVLVSTQDKGGIKNPAALQAIEAFQARMLADPEVGGTRALPAVVRQVNQLTHYGDPLWAQLPGDARDVGGLMFTYMASSPIPGALKEFVSADENAADIVLFYKDHRASTVTRAADMAEKAIADIAPTVPGLSIQAGGGIIGVTAAANEALHRDHLVVIPLVMASAFLLVAMYYRSLHAGWLMVLPMLFSTTLSYAYMWFLDIGISVNTVPVIAVGVGVGIDYAVYFMDRIREEIALVRDMREACIRAVATTGYAVSFTAVTLIAGVVLWIFMADLRFQADSAMLLSFMLIVNAIAAMFIVPAWCMAFKPRFVAQLGEGEPDVGKSGGHVAKETSVPTADRVGEAMAVGS